MLVVASMFMMLGSVLVPSVLTDRMWVCGHPDCMVDVQSRLGKLRLATLLGHPLKFSIPWCMLMWKTRLFIVQPLLCLVDGLTRLLLCSTVVVCPTFMRTCPQLA